MGSRFVNSKSRLRRVHAKAPIARGSLLLLFHVGRRGFSSYSQVHVPGANQPYTCFERFRFIHQFIVGTFRIFAHPSPSEWETFQSRHILHVECI
jgi:hypothetical protein